MIRHQRPYLLFVVLQLLSFGRRVCSQPGACPAGQPDSMIGAARCFGAAAAQQPWLGHATAAGTAAYAAARTTAAPQHFRHSGVQDAPGSLTLSSLGVGTYLGGADEATDARVAAAIVTVRAVQAAHCLRYRLPHVSLAAATCRLTRPTHARLKISHNTRPTAVPIPFPVGARGQLQCCGHSCQLPLGRSRSFGCAA